jgi:hypothetical protein
MSAINVMVSGNDILKNDAAIADVGDDLTQSTPTDSNLISQFQAILAKLPGMQAEAEQSLLRVDSVLPVDGDVLPETELLPVSELPTPLSELQLQVSLTDLPVVEKHAETVKDEKDPVKADEVIATQDAEIAALLMASIMPTAALQTSKFQPVVAAGDRVSTHKSAAEHRDSLSHLLKMMQGGLSENSKDLFIGKTQVVNQQAENVSQEASELTAFSFDALLSPVEASEDNPLNSDSNSPANITATLATPSEARSAKPMLPPTLVHLSTPVYKPEWVEQFHGRIQWLVDQQVSSAQVILDPPELGPVQVDIAHTAESTQITFTVNNAAIKELLDANMARLKSVMPASENQSVQVDVRQQQQQQQQAQGQTPQVELERRLPIADKTVIAFESDFVGRPQGLLDHYV